MAFRWAAASATLSKEYAKPILKGLTRRSRFGCGVGFWKCWRSFIDLGLAHGGVLPPHILVEDLGPLGFDWSDTVPQVSRNCRLQTVCTRFEHFYP